MTIETYIKNFAKLRTDKNRNRYPALTNHRAPHKPFLLLAVMDLIAQGQITTNFIEPSFELVETWNDYYQSTMPLGSKTSMAYPFSRLATDGFWERLPKPGYDAKHEYNIKSVNRLREVYYGARMDEELFQYLCDPEARDQLRRVLIQTYFAPEVQPRVLEQGSVNLAASDYSKILLQNPETQETSIAWEKPDESPKTIRIRDQGFRKAIVKLYDHRCALCGIRMLTMEGHTVVDAAHIKRWSESQDNRPTNGLALCKLCHWSFDEGLMSVGKEYEVLVSRRVGKEGNFPGHMMTLSERPIFRPEAQHFWPGQENLEWHRRCTFKR